MSRSEGGLSASIILVGVKVTFILLLCCSSYLAGSLFGHHQRDINSLHGESMSVGRLIHGDGILPVKKDSEGAAVDCKKAEEEYIERRVQEELEKHRKQEGDTPQHTSALKSKGGEARRFPEKTMNKFANGLARVKKDDLNEFFDFGNPVETGKGTGEEDAIILYQNKLAFPSSDKSLAHSIEYNDGTGIPLTDPKTATENCDAMNVIFTDNPGQVRQCTAIIPNFESYHIHRWMRVDTVKSTPIQADLPLVPVSRGYASRGKANFIAPPFDGKFSPVNRHWGMLKTFLQNVDSVLEDLEPILKRIARNNAVIVLTCNHGQSSLLVNFACSARRRGFDLGNILVFPTDKETEELAQGLGLTTYYDEKVS